MIRRTERFTFFFRPEAPFSQWHPARFELAGKVFNCAEQYMMYGKAIAYRLKRPCPRRVGPGRPTSLDLHWKIACRLDRRALRSACRRRQWMDMRCHNYHLSRYEVADGVKQSSFI